MNTNHHHHHQDFIIFVNHTSCLSNTLYCLFKYLLAFIFLFSSVWTLTSLWTLEHFTDFFFCFCSSWETFGENSDTAVRPFCIADVWFDAIWAAEPCVTVGPVFCVMEVISVLCLHVLSSPVFVEVSPVCLGWRHAPLSAPTSLYLHPPPERHLLFLLATVLSSSFASAPLPADSRASFIFSSLSLLLSSSPGSHFLLLLILLSFVLRPSPFSTSSDTQTTQSFVRVESEADESLMMLFFSGPTLMDQRNIFNYLNCWKKDEIVK